MRLQEKTPDNSIAFQNKINPIKHKELTSSKKRYTGKKSAIMRNLSMDIMRVARKKNIARNMID